MRTFNTAIPSAKPHSDRGLLSDDDQGSSVIDYGHRAPRLRQSPPTLNKPFFEAIIKLENTWKLGYFPPFILATDYLMNSFGKNQNKWGLFINWYELSNEY